MAGEILVALAGSQDGDVGVLRGFQVENPHGKSHVDGDL